MQSTKKLKHVLWKRTASCYVATETQKRSATGFVCFSRPKSSLSVFVGECRRNFHARVEQVGASVWYHSRVAKYTKMITGLHFQTVNADCCYNCGLQETQLCTKETGVCHNSLCNTFSWSSLKEILKKINSFLDKFSSWLQSIVSYQKLHKQSPLPCCLIKQNTNSLPTMNLDSEYKKSTKNISWQRFSVWLMDICITSILSVRLSFIASCLEGGGQKKLFCHYNVKASALPNVKCSLVSLLCSVSSHAEACVFSPVSHKCCQLFKQLGVLSVNFSDNVQPQECFLPWSANLDLDKVDSPAPCQPSLVSLTVYQFVLASEKASLRVAVVSTFWSFFLWCLIRCLPHC